jgi:ABC-type antimicrobial peptide transport system permease subunit
MIVWGFKTKWTQYRTELQNFTLCIVIITMFMSLNQSFIYTNSVYDSLMQGNGELLNVYLEDSASLADLTESTRTIENNLDTLNLEALNAIYYTGSVQNYFHLENIYITHQDLTSKRDLYQSGYKFCTTNYSKILDNMVLRDEWFVGGSASEILTALNEQEDAVLFPTSMCKGNFSIGGPITFSYKTLNGTIVNRKGTIIGTYNMFPTMVPSASIFMNPLLLETALISKLEIVLYNPDPITPAQHADFQSLCRVNIAQYINFQLVVLQVEYPLFKLLFRFLKIYTILVIIFTLIGISLNIFFNYSKKNIQQGLIRAYGYRKRDLIKLNLQENGIFALFGVIFSLFSFIGTGFYILIINVSTIAQFPLFYRIDYGVYFLTLSIGGFLFIGLNILFSFRSIMQTDTKKNLEKILRYRY